MRRTLTILTLIACIGTNSTSVAQTESDRPHATIHFVRGKNVIIPNCENRIMMADQADFKLQQSSIANFTVYTEGKIAITLAVNCKGGGRGPRAGSEQLFLDILHGKEFYIDMTGAKFELTTKEDLEKHLGKITDIADLQESLETPITPVTE